MSRLQRFSSVFASVALVVALAACAPEAGAPSDAPSTPTVTHTPTVEAGLFACEDLVTPDAVAAALTGSDGVVPTPVLATQPSAAFDSAVLRGAGGLACSWRVGEGQQRVGDGGGDWAYLQLSVLPGAAAQHKPVWAGDSPSTDTIEVGGITASVAQGETGWQISAPVGDSWVHAAVRASGLIPGNSRFEGMPQGAVLEALAAAAGEAFEALADAAPERTAWPALEGRVNDAACTGGLDQVGIVSAMMIDPAQVLDYVMTDERATEPSSIENAARAAAGVFTCELRTDGMGGAMITVVRGYAPELAVMSAEADTSHAFEPLALEGAVAPESAIVAVREDGPRSPVYFTVGSTLYEVYSDGSQTVAEAIIAQTR